MNTAPVPEISDLFSVSVDETEAHFLNDLVVLLLLRLLLLLAPVLPLLALFLEMLVNFRKVTLLQVPGTKIYILNKIDQFLLRNIGLRW